jgi:putative sterol carrier protein
MHKMHLQMVEVMRQNSIISTQLSQAVSAAGASPHSASSTSLPRIRQPNVFKGDMGFVVDDWISELEQQFAYYKEKFTDGASKVKYAVAYLAGPAVHWWEHEPSSKAEVLQSLSWEVFKELLHGRFRPVQAAMIARQRLDKLRQRQGQSVNQFASLVQTIMTPISDMSEADQVHKFVNGLFTNIAGKVWERHPKSLKEAIDYAVSVEAMGNYGRAAMAPSGSYSHFGRSQGSNHSTGASSSSAPMDLSNVNMSDDSEESKDSTEAADPMALLVSKLEAMEHRLNAMFKPSNNSNGRKNGNKDRVPGLTSEDIVALRSAGKCFRCKKTGHFKRECPLNL